jgi:hypothetical protein
VVVVAVAVRILLARRARKRLVLEVTDRGVEGPDAQPGPI